MIEIVQSHKHYHFENDWLSTYWHFSFDHYYDPKNLNFGPLRVFNDDIVAPRRGFPMHGHKEMEILTYVLSGELEHRDSGGHQDILRAGEVQHMSAGTGIRHSEMNPSADTSVHLLQLWLLPAVAGLTPSYAQKSFPAEARRNALLAVASGRDIASALKIHQDATMFIAELAAGKEIVQPIGRDRRAYLFVISGAVELNQDALGPGDVVKVTESNSLGLVAREPSHLLLLDLP